MPSLLAHAVSFALPCWITNMALSLSYPLKRIFPSLSMIDKPVDGGRFFLGRPIFGKNRGYLSVIIAIILAVGLGATTGSTEMVVKVALTIVGTHASSFIKRRFGIPSGTRFPIVDQADYMILVACVWYALSLESLSTLALALALTIIGQPVVCLISYKLGMKAKPY